MATRERFVVQVQTCTKYLCVLFLPCLFALIAPSAVCAQATTQTLTGLVRAPRGVSTAGLTVTLFDRQFTSIENDHQPLARAAVEKDGEFEIAWTPKPTTELEISGDGVRRARFPWPAEQIAHGTGSPVFRLSEGVTLRGRVLSAADESPVANVKAGPIVPGVDAPAEAYDTTYPFFAAGDESGALALTGLLKNTSYEVQFFAPGFERRKATFAPGEDFAVRLQPGGVNVKARVLFEDTVEPVPFAIAILSSEENGLNVERRADEEGRVAFAGMPPGNYHIAAREEQQNMMRHAEVTVTKDLEDREWPVFVVPGINIGGMVVDAETAKPVGDAYLALGNQSLRTAPDGKFLFQHVYGPWPRTFEFEHPDYKFVADDQSAEQYPLNGWDAMHIRDMVVPVRRHRVLEVLVETDEPEVAAALELHDLPASANALPRRDRITEKRTVLPLTLAGERLALLRNQRLSSAVTPLKTDITQTTTTLRLDLGPGAGLAGSLTYVEEDAPPPSFTITLHTLEDGNGSSVNILQAAPDSAGRFNLQGLPPGEFLLRLNRTDQAEPYHEQRVTLVRGETANIEKQMHRGLTVTGTVVDEEEKPLNQIEVRLYATDPQGQSLHLKKLTTEDGRFDFEGLGGESIRQISITHHQYENQSLEDIPLKGEPITIVLKAKGAITVNLQAAAEDLATAEAYLLPANQNQAPNGEFQWMSFIDVTEQFAGEPTVKLLPRSQGRMRVAARAGAQWDVSPAFEWAGGSGEEVTLRPGSKASLTVTVEGWKLEEGEAMPEVFLLNTTLPESLATVEFTPQFYAPSRFEFDAVPPGDYILLFSTADGRTATRTGLELESGTSQNVSLKLGGGLIPFTGRIVVDDDSAKPNYPAQVSIRFADVPEAELLDQQSTNSRGDFEFPGLVAGRPYLLDVTLDGMAQRFPIAALSPSSSGQTYALTKAMEVDIVLPPRLAEAAQQSEIPLQLVSTSGDGSVIFRAPEGHSTQSLRPGSYHAYWGENPLGAVEIAKNARTVTLPDLK